MPVGMRHTVGVGIANSLSATQTVFMEPISGKANPNYGSDFRKSGKTITRVSLPPSDESTKPRLRLRGSCPQRVSQMGKRVSSSFIL